MLTFIGTLHLGLTPKDELIKIIEEFNPSRLLVEIAQVDIESSRTEDYPDEMQAALHWGKSNHIEVYGFDSSIQPMKEEVSEESLKTLDNEQMAVIVKYNWKDFNTSYLANALKTTSWHKVIDKTKDYERELKMSTTIGRLSDDSTVTVVVTGSGHIPFFKNKFPDAQFPLATSAAQDP